MTSVITRRLIVAHLLVLVAVDVPARAQSASDVSISFGGLIHAEGSYAWITDDASFNERDRIGIGLHRTRLRATARIGPKFGAFIHLDADAGTFGVLDAFVTYDPTASVRLRLGRMASAQPRAFILTPLYAMDGLDRAAIALRWNGGTLGTKGRDFGIDLRYAAGPVEAIVFLHNGHGSFDRMIGNFQEGIVGDVTGGTEWDVSDLAVSVYGALRPATVSGLELGGFAGYNGSRNSSTAVFGAGRRYASYSAHAYWGAEPGSQAVRLKADVIGIRYEELSLAPTQSVLGLSLLAAVGVHRAAEVFARAESFDPNLDTEGTRDVYATAGFSFSTSKLRGRPYGQEKLTIAYSARVPEDDDAPRHQLLQLQLQVNF